MKRRWLRGLLLGALTLSLVALYQRTLMTTPGALTWHYGETELELLQPRALGILLVIPALYWVLGRSLADLPWQQRWLSLLLRVGFLALLSVSLADFVRTSKTERVCLALLVDTSDSVSDAALARTHQRLEELAQGLDDRPEDLLKIVAFGARPRLLETRRDDAGHWVVPPLTEFRQGRGSDANGRATNLQAALELAHGVFPEDYLRRAVLFSDGVETAGNLLAEATRTASFEARLFAVPLSEATPPEFAIVDLSLPSKVEIGEPFQVTAMVYASRPGSLRVRLFQGETLNGLDAVRPLELQPGTTAVDFASVVRFGGEVSYRAVIDQLPEDTFAENNQYQATVDVPGRPSVLYIEGQPAHARYLASALGAQQFDVDVRSAAALPGSLAELERYDLVIVSDVPAEQVGSSAQNLIERYVRDLGGGFVFAGGQSGYGLGGWANTTFERMLPVRMDMERRKDIPSVALALVIDRSGSMTGLPMEMAKAACAATVETLEGDDLIEVIAFDSTPKRYVKMQPARYTSRIKGEIARIQPGGGTQIFPALDAAYQDMSVTQARKKHVILLTDGRADTQGIRDLVQAMLSESITVTTVGLGDDADAELLRMVAESGGGRYHHVPDPSSLPRIFTRETEMITRQSAVVEWFPVVQVQHADFLRGISVASAPLLHGYVATQLKPAPAQLILASDTGEPILARWRVGLGWAVAWTSDVKNNWAIDWLSWRQFGTFWGQLAREHMRRKTRHELDMTAQVYGGRVHASVDALTADERFDNDMSVKLQVKRVGADKTAAPRELTMPQTAPGRYEADFDLDEYGSFSLQAQLFRPDAAGELTQVSTSYGQVNQPYPLEYASFSADVDKLQAAVTTAGGSLDPSFEALMAPDGQSVVERQPLRERLLLWALVVFVLDLLVRRVRLFDRKIVAGALSR